MIKFLDIKNIEFTTDIVRARFDLWHNFLIIGMENGDVIEASFRFSWDEAALRKLMQALNEHPHYHRTGEVYILFEKVFSNDQLYVI